MSDQDTTDGLSSMVTRRKALKAASALTAIGLGASSTASATPDDKKVFRLRGSYQRPLSLNETLEKRRNLIEKHPHADDGRLENRAEPEFSEEVEIVEYVARITTDGHVSQYYGGATEEKESVAHDRGEEKEQRFETENEIGVQSDGTSTDFGGDWELINDNQASSDSDFGTVINNYEWYRIREDDDEEHNAFRSRSATAPDDGFATDQWSVEHDWGRGDLDDKDVHNAEPDTSGTGIDVSIGDVLNPLEWSFANDESITQNLDNSGPTVEWSQGGHFGGIGQGTYWLHPGSHVVSDRANCWSEQDVIYLTTEANWVADPGIADDDSHTWRIYTNSC